MMDCHQVSDKTDVAFLFIGHVKDDGKPDASKFYERASCLILKRLESKDRTQKVYQVTRSRFQTDGLVEGVKM